MSKQTDDIHWYGEKIPESVSLRDYFAAAALSSMDAIRELNILEPGKENSQMAQRAYRIADAMLRAREAKP